MNGPTPVEMTPEAVLTFSPLVMVPIIAGVVQVFVDAGMSIRYSSLAALVLGVVLGVLASFATGIAPFVGLVQGTVVGLAAAGLWLNLSSKVNTNGSTEEKDAVGR